MGNEQSTAGHTQAVAKVEREIEIDDEGKEVFEEEQTQKAELVNEVVEETDSFYDVIVAIDSLEEILPKPHGKGAGWKVKFSPEFEESFSKVKNLSDLVCGQNSGAYAWSSSVVAVLGLYNKGKTFVLNKLCNVQLGSGNTVHTEGLSFKVIRNKNVNHILLDTAGLYSPVEFDEGRPDESLAIKKATEFFLEDLTFLLADFFVVVVNDLTSLDQEYIQKLIMKLKNHPDKVQQLYIIHNFKDAKTKDNLEKLWREQVADVYRIGEIMHDTVTAVNPVTKRLEEREVDWLNTKFSRHVYVASDFAECGIERNVWVFALLKQWLASMFVPVKRNYSALNLVLDFSNRVLPHYVENCYPLELHLQDRVLKFDISGDQKPPKLKPATMDVNGFVFADESFQPLVDTLADENGLTILVDAPGLTQKYKLTKVGWDVLRVTGKREKPYPQNVIIDKSERKYGIFKKEFKIPAGYEIRGVKHAYERGVIKIVLPPSTLEEEL